MDVAFIDALDKVHYDFQTSDRVQRRVITHSIYIVTSKYAMAEQTH